MEFCLGSSPFEAMYAGEGARSCLSFDRQIIIYLCLHFLNTEARPGSSILTMV